MTTRVSTNLLNTDIVASLNGKVNAADLQSTGGTALVGLPGGGTLQDVIVPYATRSAMAGRANKNIMAYLTETGRQGYFYWSGVNNSANVTSDPQQAFYVAPTSDPTGASGCWVRAETVAGTALVTWFGAVGAGGATDDTTAMLAAISWLNAVRGRTLVIPPPTTASGSFTFSQDLIITQNNATICGSGGSYGKIRGNGGAKIKIGIATQNGVSSSGLPIKGGTKASYVTLSCLAIQPAGNHPEECVLLDYCDSTLIEFCDIGPSTQDGSTFTIGIKTNWVQWVYIDRCQINVNGCAIWIKKPTTATENEDHFHITRNQIYLGKTPPVSDTRTPANITIEADPNCGYAIFEFQLRGNHIGKFMSGSTAATTLSGGIRAIIPDTSGDWKVFHTANICDNFFEYVNYPIDFERGVSGTANSAGQIYFTGNTVLSPSVVFSGTGVTKLMITCGANYFLQGDTLVDGARLFFTGYNSYSSMTTLSVQGLNNHRYAFKQTGAGSLAAIRMEARGTASVASGQTYVDITHSLSMTPTDFTAITTSSNWVPNFWISAVGATTFRINFADPGAAKSIRWTASVADG